MKKIYFIICLFILTLNFSFSQTNGGCEGYAEVLGVNNGIFNFPPQYLCTHLPVAIHRHLGCSGAYDIGGSDPGVVYFTWNQVNNEYITYYFATPGTHVFDFTYTPNSCCPVPPPVHEMYTVTVPAITTQIYYPDADDDGFPGSLQGSAFCYDPPGYALLTQFGLDCDDNNPAIAFAKVYYSDLDNDNYGDPLDSTSVCSLIPPSGYVINNTDAFPNDPLEHMDSDGDGIGDNRDAFPNDPSEITDNDNDGYGSNSDCEDNNDYINPGATEIPGNGIDENCDPSDDGGNIITWTGSVSKEWKVADNWVPQQIPTATDDVLIPATAPVFPVSSATNACHHLTIETGASLTMTGGSLSIYGTVNATVNTSFDLQAGTLKLYYGTAFPADMTFNNLTISMSPTSSDEIDNIYKLPGLVFIKGNLTMTGTGDLPKINQNTDEGIYLDKNLTINGGLIGMATLSNATQEHLPFLALTGTSIQTVKIINLASANTLDHNLIISNPDVMLKTNLSLYSLKLESNFNTQEKNILTYGDLIIAAGTSLTMTAGTLSMYGTITAPDASCFNLQGGTLRLFHAQSFPVDMDFNNLSIYMNPSSSTETDNTYIFSGLNNIHGNLIMNGTGNLPKINQALDEGFYLDGNLTINGGLIGMSTSPANGLQDHLPYIALTGTATQNIKINNSPLANALDHNLVISNSNVVLQSALSVYNLVLQSNLDLKGKNLDISGKLVYNGPTAITNSVPYAGQIIIENKIPVDDQPLSLKIDNAKAVIADASALNNNIYLDGNLQVLQLQISNGVLDLMGHDLTVGRTISPLGYLNVLGYIYNSDPSGTFSLLGNSSCQRYQLTGGSFFNFTLNSPNGVEINNNILSDAVIINGTATLTKGSFDVKEHNVLIGLNAGNIAETAGNVFYSSLPPAAGGVFVRSTINNPASNLNINGAGLIVTSTGALHEIEIARYCTKETGSPFQTFIYRLFRVKNDAGGTGLQAKIKLKYDESELSGVNESELWMLRKKSTETIWTIMNSTVNTSSNTVTATVTYSRIDISNPNDPADYTMYTIGDANNTLRNGITINGKTEQVLLQQNQLFLFPNPAKDKLEIRMNATTKQSTLEVISITGKQLISKTIFADHENNYRESLDINNLSGGIYILKLVNESGTQVEKFVKQ